MSALVITRRDEILIFIAHYSIDHHNAPSSREIATHFGISQTATYEHLKHLLDEKRLVQVDGKWRIPDAEYVPPPNMF